MEIEINIFGQIPKSVLDRHLPPVFR